MIVKMIQNLEIKMESKINSQETRIETMQERFNKDLLLLLSHFSCVQLCVTPETAAHQAPPSLGFSRQEHWSGLPFPSPMHESESEIAQSCLTLSDPMDFSLPGSSIHGTFQARVLEWGAIAFSMEQDKCPPNQTKEEEIGNLPEKYF